MTWSKQSHRIFSDIVEKNGKTIRENNLERKHKYPLGTIADVEVELISNNELCIVNLKGTCRLFIVGHTRDCDGTPLYILSDIPIEYPKGSEMSVKAMYNLMASVVELNRSEEALNPISKHSIAKLDNYLQGKVL